ncbi:MAG: hypothetical protein ACK4UY_01535 [Dietzia sp.]
MNVPDAPDGGGGARRSWVFPALAVVVVVGVLVVVATTVALNRAPDDTPLETVATPTSQNTTTTSTRAPRTTTTTAPGTTVVAVPAAVCDAGVINADLGYPGSGSRVIDCGGGWAVMASEISGDPYWVVFRNGRWRHADGVSIYTMTCPDEAIAMGAPAWLARKYLVTCRTSDWSVVSSGPRQVPSTRPTATLPVTTLPVTTLPTTAPPPTTRAQSSAPTSVPATSQAPAEAPSDTSTSTGGSATAASPGAAVGG